MSGRAPAVPLTVESELAGGGHRPRIERQRALTVLASIGPIASVSPVSASGAGPAGPDAPAGRLRTDEDEPFVSAAGAGRHRPGEGVPRPEMAAGSLTGAGFPPTLEP